MITQVFKDILKEFLSVLVRTLDTEFEYHWNIKEWGEALGETDKALENFYKYDLFNIILTKVIQKVKNIALC